MKTDSPNFSIFNPLAPSSSSSGDLYVVSFEYKIISGNPEGTSYFQIAAGDFLYFDYGSDTTMKGTDDSFILIYSTFNIASPSADNDLLFFFQAPEGSNKTVYLQNVQVYPAPPNHSTVTDLIINPGFESGLVKPWDVSPNIGPFKVVSPGIKGKYALIVHELFDLSQIFNAVVGTRYVVKFSYQISATGGLPITVTVDKSSSNIRPIATANKTTTVARVFTATQGPNAIFFDFENGNVDASTLLDAISVESMPG